LQFKRVWARFILAVVAIVLRFVAVEPSYHSRGDARSHIGTVRAAAESHNIVTAGSAFQILAAATGKAWLPIVYTLNDGRTSLLEMLTRILRVVNFSIS